MYIYIYICMHMFVYTHIYVYMCGGTIPVAGIEPTFPPEVSIKMIRKTQWMEAS